MVSPEKPPTVPTQPVREAKQGPMRHLMHKLREALGIKRPNLLATLEEVIEEHDERGFSDGIEAEEREIFHNVISFAGLHVRDIMTPRSDIVYVSETVPLEKLQQTIVAQAHTRIPVCRGTLDEVRGFIHIKDLVPYLAGEKPFRIEEIMRQALFVPPSMKLSDLLLHMRASRTHMAMVVDEFGGTCGLVTLEDLIEEIVGEINDEHDDETEAPFFREAGNGSYEASGRITISDLEQLLDERIARDDDSNDYDTLGGLLFSLLGRVPVTGEIISHSPKMEFEILEADPRRIKRVLIRRKAGRRRKSAAG